MAKFFDWDQQSWHEISILWIRQVGSALHFSHDVIIFGRGAIQHIALSLSWLAVDDAAPRPGSGPIQAAVGSA